MSSQEIGSVYLASTESELKRGWIKCGMTTRDSKTRISEGNVASVRERYEMLYTKETEYFIELEKHMHDKLKAFKFPFKKDKNETFNITSSKIWELIEKLEKKRETFEAKEREKTKSIHKQK